MVDCAFYGESPSGVCKKTPEAKKRTVAYVGYDEDTGEDITEDVWLPICHPCNSYWFDGTEEYPKLYPL